jgi:sulfonate transport system permease protein
MSDIVSIEAAGVDEGTGNVLGSARRKITGLRARLVRFLTFVAVPIGLILTWDLAVRFDAIPSTLIAAPLDVVQRLIELLVNGKLERHVGISLMRLVQGFGYGSLLGIAVGTAVGASRLASTLIEPSLLTMIPVPAVAWVPLLIVLLGIGESSKVVLIGIGSFCTLFLHTAHGIRSTDRKLVEVAHILGKGRAVLIARVLLPAALPEIFAAARIAMALSWALLIVAEVIASSSGLGWLIWDARNFNRPADMIVGMIAIGALGKLSDTLLGKLGRFATRWRDTYGDHG